MTDLTDEQFRELWRAELAKQPPFAPRPDFAQCYGRAVIAADRVLAAEALQDATPVSAMRVSSIVSALELCVPLLKHGDPARARLDVALKDARALAAEAPQEAAQGQALPDVSELLVWAVEDELLQMSKIMDADLQDALVAYSRHVAALAQTAQPAQAFPQQLRIALEDLDAMESLGPTTEAVIDAAQQWYLATPAQPTGEAT